MDDTLDDTSIANFCSVTGADNDTAIHYLSAAAGDVNIAVSLFLDSGNQPPNQPSQSMKPMEESLPSVRAPIQPKRSILVEEGPTTSTMPSSMFNVVEPFRDFRYELPPSPFTGTSNDEKGRRLAELFKPPTEIMFKGAFDSARRVARDEHRWILVTVHNPTEFPCQMMVRDVWNASAVQDFIKESMLFIFLTVGTAESERYMQYYPVETFPHWAIIDPRTGKRVMMGSKTMKAVDMLQILVEYVSDHPLAPKPLSVEEDLPLQSMEPMESTESSTGSTESIDAVPITNEKKKRTFSLPEEPSGDIPDAITVQIRFPNGQRQKRRFFGSDKIQNIFDYVQCMDPSLENFDIQAHTKSLLSHKEDTIFMHNLKNAALTVVL